MTFQMLFLQLINSNGGYFLKRTKIFCFPDVTGIYQNLYIMVLYNYLTIVFFFFIFTNKKYLTWIPFTKITWSVYTLCSGHSHRTLPNACRAAAQAGSDEAEGSALLGQCASHPCSLSPNLSPRFGETEVLSELSPHTLT